MSLDRLRTVSQNAAVQLLVPKSIPIQMPLLLVDRDQTIKEEGRGDSGGRGRSIPRSPFFLCGVVAL